jgi:predicted dehydrogenase
MNNTTIGLVGCGAWGKNILRDLIALNCRVYVAARSAGSQNMALELGAEKAFAKADELPECDGYIVAVPIPDLAPVSMTLLKRKKPIFAEKTLCLSTEMADELEKAGGDKYIFVMHKWHYHPGIEALRVVAGSGRIGKLLEISTIRYGWVNNFHGGDVFWTLGVHDLTIIKHILGHIPDDIIYSKAINGSEGFPVSLTAIIGRSPSANISINARHAEKLSGVSIFGSKGTLVLHDAYDDHITVRDENGEEKIMIDRTFPLFLELKEFIGYLNGAHRPSYGMDEAREVTKVLLALREKSTAADNYEK